MSQRRERSTWTPTPEWFAQRHGLKRSRSVHLCRLIGQNCALRRFNAYECLRDIENVDHPVLWVRDGKAVCLTWEPYGMGMEAIGSAFRFAEKHGLHLSVDTRSWHNYGACLLVELWISRAASWLMPGHPMGTAQQRTA